MNSPFIDEKRIEMFKPCKKVILFTVFFAFVIPVIIMALAFVKVQVWPGSKFTIYIFDLQAQFAPLISSLRYVGKSDNSLLWSFYGALGNNAFLNYALYILDPTMWLTVFFPLEQMPNVIYFIALFKVGLCGAGASIFFLFGFKGRKYPFVILLLSICYALMSYNIMYGVCIRWYNVIALAPLALLGIEHMIEGKKGGLYIICMTLSLYSSTQLSYMTGVFAILYLIWRVSENTDNYKKIIGRFVICNGLCAFMYMPFFLPFAYNVMHGRMKTYNYMSDRFFYYPLVEVIKQFISCRYDTIESGGLPLIFCGTFIPLIALASLLLPLKSIVTRLISVAIFIFFVSSFCFVPFNQFWHGFNEPNAFPARYSFLFCLYMLILAYRFICFVLDRLCLPKRTLLPLYGLLLAVTCGEMYLNAGYILTSLNIEMSYCINEVYQRQIRDVKDVLDHIDDANFYRVGRDVQYTFNDGMLFGYNGMGYFSSMFERNTMDFIGKLGYSQFEQTIRDCGGTPLAESLLGIKYKILNYPDFFGYYEPYYKNKTCELQYNDDALPLGFLVKYRKYSPEDDEELVKGISDQNSFDFQEFVLSELSGKRVNAFEKIDYSLEDVDTEEYARHVRMTFTATSDKPIWIYCKDECEGVRVTDQGYANKDDSSSYVSSTGEEPTNALLSVNGENRYPFVDRLSTMCTYLGTFREGEEVEVEAACVNKFEDPWIVYYNEDNCRRAFSEIKKTGMEITDHKNGVIKGRIKVSDCDEIMIMTLPYMKGYRVKVDGISTDYGSYRDALFALKMEPGDHTVEISFIPYGLILGSVIGLISLILTVLYLTPIKMRTSKV